MGELVCGALINGISVLIKRSQRDALTLLLCEDTVRSQQSVTWKRALTRT